MAQRHISLSISPFLVIYANTSKSNQKKCRKMDEYIRSDNDFRQRREEAFWFSEMTRGFGGRFHPRHVRSIHNSTQSDDRGSQRQRPQYSSQALGQQQSSFRPSAPRGRGARGFGGRFGDQPRKIYCLFCGEDKGHTTRMCHVTIQKQKEIAEAAAQQSQPKQVMHTADRKSTRLNSSHITRSRMPSSA